MCLGDGQMAAVRRIEGAEEATDVHAERNALTRQWLLRRPVPGRRSRSPWHRTAAVEHFVVGLGHPLRAGFHPFPCRVACKRCSNTCNGRRADEQRPARSGRRCFSGRGRPPRPHRRWRASLPARCGRSSLAQGAVELAGVNLFPLHECILRDARAGNSSARHEAIILPVHLVGAHRHGWSRSRRTKPRSACEQSAARWWSCQAPHRCARRDPTHLSCCWTSAVKQAR